MSNIIPRISIAVAIALSAYITWTAVNKSNGTDDRQWTMTASLMRLQSGIGEEDQRGLKKRGKKTTTPTDRYASINDPITDSNVQAVYANPNRYNPSRYGGSSSRNDNLRNSYARNKNDGEDGSNKNNDSKVPDENDGKDGSNKKNGSDARNKNDGKDGSNKNDGKNDTNKNDGKDDTNKNDGKGDTNKSDGKDDTNKDDGKDDTNTNNGGFDSSGSTITVRDHDLWKRRSAAKYQSGLTVEVLNNLQPSSDWNDHLDYNVQEWGKSDALSLSLRTVDTFDPDCNVVKWSIKVCNDDHGETGWKGVNRIMLHNGEIIASVAIMNDYYLYSMDEDSMQYTMCHELGHGFGLKHSDVNFNNKDLGECMDYTNRPKNNMSPGSSNYAALEDMYGNINGRRLRAKSNADIRMNEEKGMHMLKDFDKYAAHLSGPIIVSSQNSNGGEAQGSRLLRNANTVDTHEIQLGDGYSVRTNLLLA